MRNIVLKITRNSESSFSVCRKAGSGANLDFLSSWNTVNAERIDGGKSVKSGYLYIIARPDKWVCTSDCIFGLNDSNVFLSVNCEYVNHEYPTIYLLHYEFDWRKLQGQKQTELDVVWCSSSYLIDYTSGYEKYKSKLIGDIVKTVCKYEEKRKNRANPRHT